MVQSPTTIRSGWDSIRGAQRTPRVAYRRWPQPSWPGGYQNRVGGARRGSGRWRELPARSFLPGGARWRRCNACNSTTFVSWHSWCRRASRTHTLAGGAAMTPRVLIVDDEVDSCWLVAFVLRRDPNLALAGEATDGEMALSLVSQERPDVVVTDIKMPRLDGLEATRRIKREWPDTKVLVLTHLTDDHTRREAFEKGADAFLNKRDMASALVPAIWDACG